MRIKMKILHLHLVPSLNVAIKFPFVTNLALNTSCFQNLSAFVFNPSVSKSTDQKL